MSFAGVSVERLRLAGFSKGWQLEYATGPHDEDRLIKDMPPLRLGMRVQFLDLPEGIAITAHATLSRPDFSALINALMNEPQGHEFPLEVWVLEALADRALIQFEDILSKQLSESEKRVESFDWNSKLEHFIHHRPDSPGTRQLAHLAALAYKGDLSKLLDYQDAFAKGKRLNFATMISSEVMERAVDIAALR
ncbi:hypothetical protein DES53_109245 [Roseimicrobium gellanilyticum]|uniref:Uncharacterized protein n=1 Tax=Roseimicrobium gellanilyticum TaxID=748857 RepID=A0A366HC07_9BACT|nr:hypothetical protein [Roseimicrobium gellanilyticum]RBP39817.1 hypothetical protein DES53_109245 [Roseimicrobium gellanilyticum]